MDKLLKALQTQEWKQLHNVADRNIRLFEIVFKLAVEELRKNISVTELTKALEKGNILEIEKAIPWTTFEAHLEKWKPIIIKTMIEAGEVASDNFEVEEILKAKKKKKKRVEFNKRNVELIKFTQKQADELIRSVIKETQKAVNNSVINMFNNKETPFTTAKKIKRELGITDRQTKALNSYEQRLRDAGVNRKERKRLIQKEYQRKLEYRANLIARTESINSASQGQLIHWLDVAKQGYIDINIAMKEWIVTPDDRLCKICAPLQGERVKIYEPFSWGGLSPTRHQQCRCSMKLIKFPIKE